MILKIFGYKSPIIRR